jgi:outer membrane PBP1 activator LpoA protein
VVEQPPDLLHGLASSYGEDGFEEVIEVSIVESSRSAVVVQPRPSHGSQVGKAFRRVWMRAGVFEGSRRVERKKVCIRLPDVVGLEMKLRITY